ncbi:MAG: T9SS type A sorting domain-containing protein [Bacteroidota bacterium]
MKTTSLITLIFFIMAAAPSAYGTRPYDQSPETRDSNATSPVSLIIALNANDNGNGAGYVRFGVNTNATYCIDSSLGESELPPPPPAGSFDLRLVDPRVPSCFGQGLILDLRPYVSPSQVDTYQVSVNAGIGGYPVTFSWPDLDSLYAGSVLLQDAITGTLVNVDMKGQTSYSLANSNLHDLLIIASSPLPHISQRPIPMTNPATNLTINSATLNGTVIANADTALVTFEWGSSLSYGNSTPVTITTVSGPMAVAYNLSGLSMSSTYHYRLDARNATGTLYGGDQTFTTLGPGSAPSVMTMPATEVTGGSAQLNALVKSYASSASVNFEWGTTSAYGNSTPDTVTTASGFVPVACTINGLSAGTRYYYRAVATNAKGTSYAGDRTFVTLAPVQGQLIVPLMMSDTANHFTIERFGVHPRATYCIDANLGEMEFPPSPPAGAFDMRFIDVRGAPGACMGQGLYLDLRSFVSPSQVDTYELRFQPGDAGFPLTFSWPNLDSLYSGPVLLQDAVTGTLVNVDMKVQTSYALTNRHLSNLYIIASGPVAQPLTPIATTGYAGGVPFRFNGTVYPNGVPTYAWFEYGTSSAYGNATTLQLLPGDSLVQFSQEVSGLAPRTVYHYRIAARNANGTGYGFDQQFKTADPAKLPKVVTLPATNITAGSATLNATLESDSSFATCYFDWGTTTSYDHSVWVPGNQATAPAAITYNLTGLSPNTIYHYRIAATNTEGNAYGGDQAFTTLAGDSGWGFSIPLFVRDNGTGSGVIRFGVNVNATRCIDPALGEYELPPRPPTGDFDVRFFSPFANDSLSCFGQGLNLDLRRYDSSSQSDVYMFTVQPGLAGYPITISWPDLNPYYSGMVRMFPAYMAIFDHRPIDMKSTDSVVLGGFFTSVQIVADDPILTPPWPQQYRGAAPYIVSVRDVPFDQGGFVTVKWDASVLDTNVNYLPYYSIWRALPDTSPLWCCPGAAAHRSLMTPKAVRRIKKFKGLDYAWEWIANAPAHRFSEYSYTAPTLYDSSDLTDGEEYFLVSAQTSNPDVFYDSNVDSGYSVDNIPPDNPRELSGERIANSIRLTWSASRAADLRGYLVYRQPGSSIQGDHLMPYARCADTTFVDTDPPHVDLITYYVRAQDIHGNLSEPSPSVIFEVLGVIDAMSGIPTSYALHQNYPNPFNPSTTLAFDLPKESFVTLKLYNTLGEEVAALVNTTLGAGRYRMTYDASRLLSGVYFYRVLAVNPQTGAKQFSQTKKLLLLK